jgi:hypothetical protein
MKAQERRSTTFMPIMMSLVVLGALITARALFPAAQVAPAHRTPKSRPAPPSALPEVAMPFHVGEKLNYRISWSSFTSAALLQLSVPERRALFGWATWHFQAAFHTVRPVRTLFAIDDQFDSYTDVSSLESRQFEIYLNELGKSETTVLHLIPSGERPRAPGPAVIVLPKTRDPLGMLFALRAVDWQRTPELRAPVYDGHDLYEMRAHLETASDAIQVDAGSFSASRIAIQVFQNAKENASIHFTIWLANDAARTPLVIAAELPFGNVRVQLTSANASPPANR